MKWPNPGRLPKLGRLSFFSNRSHRQTGPCDRVRCPETGLNALLPGALGSAFAKEVGCMYADFGCMSMKRLGACMRSWVHVWEQVAFPSSQAGPGPGPWPPPHPPPTTLASQNQAGPAKAP